MPLMSQKNVLIGGTLEGQTVEMGFAAGKFALWSCGIGRGERRGRRGSSPDRGSWGAERDKSPRIKPGRKFSEGTRSGENEGRESKLPNLPFSYEPSRAEITATLEEKASTAKLNGLQIRDVPGHRVALLDLVINDMSKDAVGDSYKVWAHAA